VGRIKSGISQATVSTEGVISAEGKIGKNKASGSIDSEGVWDLGIDLKAGGLGITNDYGGAITITIAGQSITWGREGGKIHYNLGGFEVIVEARDCVVTETKLIAGIAVASHTYPDPGCKLPDPNEEPEPSPEPDPEGGIGIPGTEEFMWVCFDLIEQHYQASAAGPQVIETFTYIRSVTELEPPVTSTRTPFGVTETQNVYKDSIHKITKNRLSNFYNWIITLENGSRAVGLFVLSDVFSSDGGDNYLPTTTLNGGNYGHPLCFFGKGKDFNKFNQYARTRKTESLKFMAENGWIAVVTKTLRPTQYIPLIPTKKELQPFLQPGVPPQMNDCCEEILDALDDLKEVLHVDFFKKSKFPLPSYLLAPGVDTSKVTVANNYYNLFQQLFQALAHSTIISPKIDIKDADAVKPGDQSINSEYLSATGWAETVTKILYEIVDDGNVATNMDIRTGVTVTQLLVAVADLSHKVDCIIDCIGVTTKRTKGEVETSYNLVVEGSDSKGFDPKKANQKLDLNKDISTEQLLSTLLRTRKNPIVKEEIHPKSPTLFELLQDLKQKE
jgi:hypothetical protein